MTYLRGVDQSHWQHGTVNVPGAVFGFAKASEGTVPDDMYATHYAHFRAWGYTLVGAYHFARKDVSVASQAFWFVKYAGNADILAVDNEAKYAMGLAQLTTLITAIKAADPFKRKVILYMSDSSFLNAGQDLNWVAKWSVNPPARQWAFWQYNGSPLDMDYFHGTIAELHALANIPVAPDTSTGAPPEMNPLPIESTPTPRRIDLPSPLTFYGMDGVALAGSHDGGQKDVYSPFQANNGTSAFYAMYAGQADGSRSLILVKPTNVNPEPIVIDDGYTKATQDAAVAAQKTADQAAVDAANSAAAKSAAVAAAAPGIERERVAVSMGKAEADKVRNS